MNDNGYDSLFQINLFFLNETGKYIYNGTRKQLPSIDTKINLAFDQSSTQTGICITDDKANLIAVIDVVNVGLPSADMYIKMFRRWLNNNMLQYNIGCIVCERAEQNAPQQFTKKVLHKLIDVLDDFAYDQDAKFYQIDNKVWKKYFLADEKFKGRRVKRQDVKPAIVEKAIDLNGSLQYYYASMHGTDSADAIGIMYGFLREFYTNGFNSSERVCSIMPTFPKRKFKLIFMSLAELKEFSKTNTSGNIPVVMYNDEYTLEDNARRIINFYDNGACLYTNSEKTKVLWGFSANRDPSTIDCVMIKYDK